MKQREDLSGTQNTALSKSLGGFPLIMGIINITPDSFYEGSRTTKLEQILLLADKMIEQGASILDLGAMSSRPGARIISVEEETSRINGITSAIKEKWPKILVSIDTIHAKTAEKCIFEGADIINDISGGLYDKNMVPTISTAKIPFICMHMKGTPETMKSLSSYDNLILEIYSYFSSRVRELRQAGIHDVILDPGFGFAKNIDQNFHLLHSLDLFHSLGCPILAGLSRKSTIYKTLDISPEEALNGTTVLNTVALLKGAHILRVHDVKEAKQAIKLTQCLKPS
jgi:dihydropteroate synthase